MDNAAGRVVAALGVNQSYGHERNDREKMQIYVHLYVQNICQGGGSIRVKNYVCAGVCVFVWRGKAYTRSRKGVRLSAGWGICMYWSGNGLWVPLEKEGRSGGDQSVYECTSAEGVHSERGVCVCVCEEHREWGAWGVRSGSIVCWEGYCGNCGQRMGLSYGCGVSSRRVWQLEPGLK